MKQISSRKRARRSAMATACLTFGTVWAMSIAALPTWAQDAPPTPATPTTPETTDETESPILALPQSQNAPTAGIPANPAAPQASPFQRPKAESLPPAARAPDPLATPRILSPNLSYILPTLGEQSATATKTRRILALREMLKLGLTADDIAKTLPSLRRLRDAASQPPADPDKALDDEYQALLKARPGDPLPPSSALKLQNAAQYYRDEQRSVWADMTKQIGAKKTDGLRALVGQDSDVFSFISIANQQGLQSYYTLNAGSKAPRVYRVSPGGLPSTPKADTRSQRGTRQTVPSAAPAAPGTAFPSVNTAPAGADTLFVTPTPPEQATATVAPQIGNGVPKPDTANRRSNLAWQPSLTYRFQNQTTNVPLLYTTATSHLSLSELIELMEQKLTAMRGGRVPTLFEVANEKARPRGEAVTPERPNVPGTSPPANPSATPVPVRPF